MSRIVKLSISAVALLVCLSMGSAQAALLFDNGPLVTHPGAGFNGADASALQTNLGMSLYGFGFQVGSGNRLADDFVVPAGGWTITSLVFYAYQMGSGVTPTITSVNVRIWNDVPSNPGAAVVFGDTTTNRLSGSVFANVYRVRITSLTNFDRPVMRISTAVNITLPPGTYWMDVQMDGDLGSGPWYPPISILGQTTTGNALHQTGGMWNPALDTGTDTPQGLPFEVHGTMAVVVPAFSTGGLALFWSLLTITAIAASRMRRRG